MEKHLMVDIETLSTQHDAAIASIGAVYFNPQTCDIYDKFAMVVNIRSYENPVIDIDTFYWWIRQSEYARNGIRPSMVATSNIDEVLNDFYDFAEEADHIWSHATFDFVIINNNLKKIINKQLPHKKARDIRTLQHIAGHVDVDDEGTPHIAIDDAIYQARCVAKMTQKLRKQETKSMPK